MSDGPDTRVVALANALLRVAYPWHDPAVDDPPVMEVGDLSDSGTATPWDLAAAILAALPPDWCGHPPDTDEDWRRLRKIEKAARALEAQLDEPVDDAEDIWNAREALRTALAG